MGLSGPIISCVQAVQDCHWVTGWPEEAIRPWPLRKRKVLSAHVLFKFSVFIKFSFRRKNANFNNSTTQLDSTDSTRLDSTCNQYVEIGEHHRRTHRPHWTIRQLRYVRRRRSTKYQVLTTLKQAEISRHLPPADWTEWTPNTPNTLTLKTDHWTVTLNTEHLFETESTSLKLTGWSSKRWQKNQN